MTPPRKLRRTPEDRSLQIGKRMSSGTGQGRVDSASPVRNTVPAKATQRRGGDCINEEFTWFEPGVLGTWTGTDRWYPPFEVQLFSVHAATNTAPTGQSLKVDVNKNGTTIFTNQNHRPTILASAVEGSASFIDDPLVALGDYLTFDIDQVGSTVAGSDLAVTIGFSVCPSAAAPPGSVVTSSCLNPDGPVAGISGLQVWLQADCITGAVNGSQITTWPDSSGNGHAFTGDSITSYPVYNTNKLNGHAGVRFDGNATMGAMLGPDLSTALASACTLFIVWSFFTPANEYVLFTTDHEFGGSHHHDQWYRFGDNTGYFSVLRSSRISSYPSSMPTSGGNYLTVKSSGSTYRVWTNGVDAGAQAAAYEAPVEPSLGNASSGQWNAYFDGWIHEVLMYDTALSDGDRGSVETYLAAKYAL